VQRITHRHSRRRWWRELLRCFPGARLKGRNVRTQVCARRSLGWHVRGGDALDTPKARAQRGGCSPRRRSFAGRASAALERWAGDRPSSRCDAMCLRHVELVAHSILRSCCFSEVLRRHGRTGTADGNISGARWHRMASRLWIAFHFGFRGRQEDPSGSVLRRRSRRASVGLRGPARAWGG